MIRLKIVNGYVGGLLPTSQPPDWDTIFPDNDPVIKGIDRENLRDEYGNLQYRVESIKDKVSVRIKKQNPSHKQIDKKTKRDVLKRIREKYTIEEEIDKIRSILLGNKEDKYLEDIRNER